MNFHVSDIVVYRERCDFHNGGVSFLSIFAILAGLVACVLIGRATEPHISDSYKSTKNRAAKSTAQGADIRSGNCSPYPCLALHGSAPNSNLNY